MPRFFTTSQRLDLPVQSALLLKNRNTFSFLCWFKVGVTASVKELYTEESAFNDQTFIRIDDTGVTHAFMRTPTNFSEIIGTTRYDDNAWHRLLFVRSAAASFQLWVDEVSQGTSAVNVGTSSATTHGAGVIGNWSASAITSTDVGDETFNGAAFRAIALTEAVTPNEARRILTTGQTNRDRLWHYELTGAHPEQSLAGIVSGVGQAQAVTSGSMPGVIASLPPGVVVAKGATDPRLSVRKGWVDWLTGSYTFTPIPSSPRSSDATTLTDTISNIGLNGPADSGAVGEANKIGLGSSDTANLAEQNAIALLNTDSAAFADQVATVAATSTQDGAALAESIKLALTATESAQIGEAMAIALSKNDTATLQELVSVALAIADAATLTEGASVTQNGGNTPSSTDAATLAESSSSTATVSTSDIGTLAEQAAIKLGAADVASLTEQIGLGLVAADSAALTEQLQIAVASAATDAGALAELQNIVAPILAAAETASVSDSARVTQNGVSSNALKILTLPTRSLRFTLPARAFTFTLPKP